ncbi:MAG: glycine cleavage system protein H [Desulfobacterales bacterium]|nr:glycine cleavage system protein H [Desulfobacterales bacterium]
MTTQGNNGQRSHFGYGSSYRKADQSEFRKGREIDAVIGGQIWKIKPDKAARAAHPCIWMQTGVVKFKNCSNYYDCTTCKYDHGMMKQVVQGKQTSWQATMKQRPAMHRVCRHSLTNRIDTRICAYDYECSKCDFDQFFEDVWTTKNKTIPQEVHEVRGFSMPADHYFHNGHAWARLESGGNVRIGLDDFAFKVFGEADGLELPTMGKELDQGRTGWGLRRRNNQADVLSPVDGVIMEVNSKVREAPKAANHDPYGDGWLFLVRHPDVKKTVKDLMSNSDSLNWINAEIDHLENMVEDVAGPLAADGGYLCSDVYGALPELGWQNLTQTFLKTG